MTVPQAQTPVRTCAFLQNPLIFVIFSGILNPLKKPKMTILPYFDIFLKILFSPNFRSFHWKTLKNPSKKAFSLGLFEVFGKNKGHQEVAKHAKNDHFEGFFSRSFHWNFAHCPNVSIFNKNSRSFHWSFGGFWKVKMSKKHQNMAKWGFLKVSPFWKRVLSRIFPKLPLATFRQTPVIPLKNAVEQGKIQRGGGKVGGETMTNLKKIATPLPNFEIVLGVFKIPPWVLTSAPWFTGVWRKMMRGKWKKIGEWSNFGGGAFAQMGRVGFSKILFDSMQEFPWALPFLDGFIDFSIKTFSKILFDSMQEFQKTPINPGKNLNLKIKMGEGETF